VCTGGLKFGVLKLLQIADIQPPAPNFFLFTFSFFLLIRCPVVALFATLETEQQRQLMRAAVVFLEFLEREVVAVEQLEHVHIGAQQDASSTAGTSPHRNASHQFVIDEGAEHVEVNLERFVLDVVHQHGGLQLEIVRLHLELVPEGDDGILEQGAFVLASFYLTDFGDNEVRERDPDEGIFLESGISTQRGIKYLVAINGILDDVIILVVQRALHDRFGDPFGQKLRGKTSGELDVFQFIPKGIVELQAGVGHVAEVLGHYAHTKAQGLANRAIVADAVALRRLREARPLAADVHVNLVVLIETSSGWRDENWIDKIVGKNGGLLLRPSKL
jgi:hypothetical protein